MGLVHSERLRLSLPSLHRYIGGSFPGLAIPPFRRKISQNLVQFRIPPSIFSKFRFRRHNFLSYLISYYTQFFLLKSLFSVFRLGWSSCILINHGYWQAFLFISYSLWRPTDWTKWYILMKWTEPLIRVIRWAHIRQGNFRRLSRLRYTLTTLIFADINYCGINFRGNLISRFLTEPRN